MYLYELNSYPRWIRSQRGPSFIQQRKRFISIPTFISESDEAGYSHESRDDRVK